MLSNYFLKAINSPLELEKNRELRIREEKIKTKTEKLFYKPIIMSKDYIGKFKEQEMRKIKQSVMGKKPEIIRDKLKDEKLMIFEHFLRQKKKKD